MAVFDGGAHLHKRRADQPASESLTAACPCKGMKTLQHHQPTMSPMCLMQAADSQVQPLQQPTSGRGGSCRPVSPRNTRSLSSASYWLGSARRAWPAQRPVRSTGRQTSKCEVGRARQAHMGCTRWCGHDATDNMAPITWPARPPQAHAPSSPAAHRGAARCRRSRPGPPGRS